MSEKEIARRRQAEKLAYTFYRIRYPYFPEEAPSAVLSALPWDSL